MAAKKLRDITGADLFKIEPLHPYLTIIKKCVAQARDAMQNDARPELRLIRRLWMIMIPFIWDIPSYCGTMPMPVFTFLGALRFTGKTVKPFCTNEGSGMGRSEQDIRRLCPGAKVENGLSSSRRGCG